MSSSYPKQCAPSSVVAKTCQVPVARTLSKGQFLVTRWDPTGDAPRMAFTDDKRSQAPRLWRITEPLPRNTVWDPSPSVTHDQSSVVRLRHWRVHAW